MRKKGKEDEQTLAELTSAHRCSQAIYISVTTTEPVTLKGLNCSCFGHIINILLTDLSQSV